MNYFNTGQCIARAAAIVCSFLLVLSLPTLAWAQNPSPAAIPIIFDTDMGNDVDDVLALGMIHALESRGELKLLAVTITKDHALAAPFTDAVNTFYGRGEIPIGVCRSGVTSDKGKYNGLVEQKDGDQLRYPHDLLSGQDAPDAVPLLRKTLAQAEDGSVVFVQVGFSTNLANLLDSKPDENSPLTGMELVKKKSRLLSMMAGSFELWGPMGKLLRFKEYNVVKDIPAAQKVADHWPTPIIWSGFEIGLSVQYPHQSIELDYGYVDHHPLAEAYYLYEPPPHNRPTWDLTNVLHTARPQHDYFQLSKAGVVSVADNGITSFKPSENGQHQYLKLSDEQKIRVTEALVQLSSQPPVAVNVQVD
jgi:purine nucleosidase